MRGILLNSYGVDFDGVPFHLQDVATLTIAALKMHSQNPLIGAESLSSTIFCNFFGRCTYYQHLSHKNTPPRLPSSHEIAFLPSMISLLSSLSINLLSHM
uniref:Uncharacterized protein n=1 Tax=Tanacetum cinerariifolium TaxID=118510 RepID=A0A699IN81_TANCI|nr:hypothetical protein [Tanacetum cinerariifolium]